MILFILHFQFLLFFCLFVLNTELFAVFRMVLNSGWSNELYESHHLNGYCCSLA